jgi:DNA-binding NtrC family response regulator
MLALQRYHWPGNVRELLNVVERSVVLSKSDIITSFDLPDVLRRESSLPSMTEPQGSATKLKSALVAPERQIILDALEANAWNRQKTAKMLGINRTTLYKKMKKFSIRVERQLTY